MVDWNFTHQCGSKSPFEVAITDPTTHAPVDLTGATVRWKFTRDDGGVFTTTGLLLLETGEGIVAGTTDGIIRGTIPASFDVGGVQSVKAFHQMFLALSGQDAVLVQKGIATFVPEIADPA